ncbi:hypothetical protein [Polaromonas sp.]|uniref:hypothetical protein n=1 Tax=Polaromonas sp. TaxID=1869339 RepID=UPI003BB70AE5
MLTYFIGFAILGFFIQLVVSDDKSALLLCLGIAILWGFTHHAIWGVVALGELLLGYVVSNLTSKR